MPKIVISYRRADSNAITSRIFDRLIARYGRESVFRDIDNIPAGVDFRTHIADAVRNSSVMLAVVGPRWLGRSAKPGARRIDEADDLVRVEIETALRSNIPLIPVLLGNTRMPGAAQLPDNLKNFAFRNALTVDPGQDFERHVERLIGQLDWIFDQELKTGGPAMGPAMKKPAMLSLPDKPSIAVLPFANLSGDPEQEYFADGIAEDVTALLSKSRGLFVIARNSSFTCRGRAVDVKTVGSELGVRYVLEGSVRKAGNRVRVTAQLIDAATGGHLWAERYDRDLTDIFAVQDEITASTSSAILPTIGRSERERAARKPPESLDAWECYHRGLWHLAKH